MSPSCPFGSCLSLLLTPGYFFPTPPSSPKASLASALGLQGALRADLASLHPSGRFSWVSEALGLGIGPAQDNGHGRLMFLVEPLGFRLISCRPSFLTAADTSMAVLRWRHFRPLEVLVWLRNLPGSAFRLIYPSGARGLALLDAFQGPQSQFLWKGPGTSFQS